MKFELYQEIALRNDIPKHNLKKGDVATIVEHIPASVSEEGYCLELFNALGETVTVITVSESEIEALNGHEVFSERSLKTA